MNVIGNNCVAGYVHKVAGQRFNNPFTWMLMSALSLKRVLTMRGKIDWMNYRIVPTTLTGWKPENYKNSRTVLVDGKVTLHYIHWREDPDAQEIRKEDNNVYYRDIDSYIREKYETRCKRMLSSAEPPVVVIDYAPGMGGADIEDFARWYDLPYPVVILQKKFSFDVSPNIRFAWSDKPLKYTRRRAEFVYKKFPELFKQ